MGVEVGGLIGLIILVADIWAIVNVFQSGTSTGAKVLWVVVILVLPVVGLIIWLLAGRPGLRRSFSDFLALAGRGAKGPAHDWEGLGAICRPKNLLFL